MSATVVTYTELLRAVTATLAESSAVQKTAVLDTMTEEPMDLPLLEVYPQSGELSSGSSTDRKAFAGGAGIKPLRQEDFVVLVDLMVRQRSHVGDDMLRCVEALDSITKIFNAQDRKPYFGHEAIKAFHWLWARTDFVYGTAENPVRYVGIRFTLTLTLF